MIKETKKVSAVIPLPKLSLTEKLLTAVHIVLKETEAELTSQIQKVVNKAIKKIVKKTDKQIRKSLKSN